jgi:hypothetical protein
MKSSWHSPIPVLSILCYLPTKFNSRIVSRQADVSKLNLLKWTLLCNHFARTTQKIKPLYSWEGVFTAPLHSNGRYFIAAGMCLPTRCLTMDVFSHFSIPDFGRHVTVLSICYNVGLGSRDRGFEFHIRHVCLVYVCVYSVFVLSCV